MVLPLTVTTYPAPPTIRFPADLKDCPESRQKQGSQTRDLPQLKTLSDRTGISVTYSQVGFEALGQVGLKIPSSSNSQHLVVSSVFTFGQGHRMTSSNIVTSNTDNLRTTGRRVAPCWEPWYFRRWHCSLPTTATAMHRSRTGGV